MNIKALEWNFAKGICSLGGCDTEKVSFTSRAEAIKEAERLTKEGLEPEVGYPCPSCMQDYYA
ncbi:hypothetical protein [Paenibacillus sp. Root52]|uniref:hypothetical protein n=1 Tax=Paenibacillus sp. Root52 TaxID=1736552 RepID=UPI001F1756CE|nr:hypothetical protein [Paenibacillus sp. Root52]